MKLPLVSVVMTVYNSQEFLNIAIDSIFHQTYKNLELIIIDDGSEDHSSTIIKNYKDPRLKYFYQSNKGLASALNSGINKSSGTYIARMDSDDLSHPDRISKQVTFLERNPEVAILGSSFDIIDVNGCVIDNSYHLDRNVDLQLEFLVRNPFGHGSVMLRKQALDDVGGYDEKEIIEDYDLWWRMAKEYQVANLPEELYSWRVVPTGISHGSSKKRQIAIHKLTARIWSNPPVLPSSLEMQQAAKHYSELGPKYLEQYTYMLTAICLALFKMGYRLSAFRLLTRLLRLTGSITAIRELNAKPLSHNYILSTIYKDE